MLQQGHSFSSAGRGGRPGVQVVHGAPGDRRGVQQALDDPAGRHRPRGVLPLPQTGAGHQRRGATLRDHRVLAPGDRGPAQRGLTPGDTFGIEQVHRPDLGPGGDGRFHVVGARGGRHHSTGCLDDRGRQDPEPLARAGRADQIDPLLTDHPHLLRARRAQPPRHVRGLQGLPAAGRLGPHHRRLAAHRVRAHQSGHLQVTGKPLPGEQVMVQLVGREPVTHPGEREDAQPATTHQGRQPCTDQAHRGRQGAEQHPPQPPGQHRGQPDRSELLAGQGHQGAVGPGVAAQEAHRGAASHRPNEAGGDRGQIFQRAGSSRRGCGHLSLLVRRRC